MPSSTRKCTQQHTGNRKRAKRENVASLAAQFAAARNDMRPYVVSHMSYASRSSFRDDIQSQLDGLDYEWPKFGSCNLKNTKNKLSFKLGSELAEEQGILVGAAEEQSGLTCRPIRQLIRRNIASHSLATRADDGDDDLEPVIDEDIPETEDEDDDIEMYERRRDQIGGRRSRRSGNARPSGNTQTIELPVATTASTASLALLPERNQYMAATLPTIKGSRLTVVVFGEISIVADIKESLISSASLVRMFIGVGPDSRSTEFVQVRDEIGGYKGRKKTSKVGVGLGIPLNDARRWAQDKGLKPMMDILSELMNPASPRRSTLRSLSCCCGAAIVVDSLSQNALEKSRNHLKSCDLAAQPFSRFFLCGSHSMVFPTKNLYNSHRVRLHNGSGRLV